MSGRPRVLTGLDSLRQQGFAPLRGKRIGLVTHTASISTVPLSHRLGAPLRHLSTAVDLFASAPGVELAALFGPEHGFTGVAQDLEGVPDTSHHPQIGVPIHSLYGSTFESLTPTREQLRDLDSLVIDLRDVGSRYYTFHGTMLYCLEAAAAVGLPVMVLDRPNPIAYLGVEGPTIRPGYESFVGSHPIPIAHGLTMGELAKLYQAERVPDVHLTVIPCEGWTRSQDPRQFAEPWVPPSPNMPALTTAIVYPGMCLIEGTNISEGRGTTRPFEYLGFPWLDPYPLAERLSGEGLPAVDFLPIHFRPMFQKHAGQTCGGIFLAATASDPAFRPVRTGVAILSAFRELLGDLFKWRTEPYEFVSHLPAIDLLFGSSRERAQLEAGATWKEIATDWEPEEAAFRERRKPYLLYPE